MCEIQACREGFLEFSCGSLGCLAVVAAMRGTPAVPDFLIIIIFVVPRTPGISSTSSSGIVEIRIMTSYNLASDYPKIHQ
jgi:hypothetical protein